MSQLKLKCEKFGLSRGLHDLLSSGDLVDVTLACQGQYIQAHKTVLAACSPHFRSLFKLQPWQQPIVFLQDVELAKLEALVDFMYRGEVTVQQEDLAGLLRLAEALKVTGLATQHKASEAEQLTTDVQHETSLSHPPPPPPTPPPAKIARRSNNCDVSKRATSPELQEVQTTSVQTASLVEQPLHAEQYWVPAIDNVGSIGQDKWPPCSQASGSLAAEQSWAPQTEGGLAEESLQASASFMMEAVDIKVEEEELRDLSEDQGSTNLQDSDAEEEEDSSHLADQTSLQGGSWCEAGPSSTEPSTSRPEAASTEPSTPGIKASTSRPASACDVASTEQPSSQRVPCVSSRGHRLIKQAPQDSKSESNDEETCTPLYFCQHCQVYFKCKTSLQSHINKTHDIKPRQPSGGVTFRCRFCRKHYKRYKSREALLRHYREQHLVCKICDTEFSTLKHLKQHNRNVHDKELMYPFICKECGTNFAHDINLKQHLKLAHGQDIGIKYGTNLFCNYCSEKFRRGHCKKEHIAQHHPEMCFTCRWCSRVFYENFRLVSHQQNVHGDKY